MRRWGDLEAGKGQSWHGLSVFRLDVLGMYLACASPPNAIFSMASQLDLLLAEYLFELMYVKWNKVGVLSGKEEILSQFPIKISPLYIAAFSNS